MDKVFCDTRFDTFIRDRLAAAVQITLNKKELSLIDLRRQRVLDIYYLRQNDSRSQTKHVKALGVTFAIYL